MNRKPSSAVLIGSITILCVAMFLQNAPHIWDLQMWDETFYMANGVFRWDRHFRFYEVSPLYSYLYRIASQFLSDTATLHLWMGVTVIAAAIIATAASVMLVSGSVALSAITTAIMLASGYSEALPKLVYAAIAIMALGFAASTRLPRLHSKMACISATSFVVSFIRPEFVIAFYAATVISIGAFAFRFRAARHEPLWCGVTIALLGMVAILSKLWVFPILNGGARALQAFGQHYSLYLYKTGVIKIDPFFNYERILATYLPGATSESDALKRYPARILGFFAYNIVNGIKAGLAAVYGIAVNHPILALSVVALAGYCAMRRKHGATAFGDLASWIVLAAPTTISIILIFARDHYLAVAATLLMLLAAILVRRAAPRDTPVGAAAVLVLTTILVHPLPRAAQPRLEAAMALRAQKPFGALLEMDGGWCYYAPRNCHSVYALDTRNANMMQYLDEGHINAVMVSAPMREWASQNGHRQFASFLDNGAPGWSRSSLSGDYALLRRDQLDTTGWGNVFTSNLMSYVHANHVGHGPGTVSQLTDTSLFVHPGANDPTSVAIDPGRLAKDAGCSRASVMMHIDKRIAPEAIARGAAVIGVTVEDSAVHVRKSVVSNGHEMTFEVDAGSPPVTMIVDDHGNSDTDWLNVDIQTTGCGH
jgi:hypothetical protein